MVKLLPLCFLILLFAFTQAVCQTTQWNADFSTISDCSKLVQKGKTSEEKEELQDDYWTLLGIVEELGKYRKAFLSDGNFINLFPTAYYHTTILEMQRIRDGEFTYPIEKMKQMIAFFEAYKYNRSNWDSKIYQNVEEHWKRQFKYAINPLVDVNPLCSEVGEVLAMGIIAHVVYDFPRTIRYAFENRFNKTLTNNNPILKLEFTTTQTIFESSSNLTLTDIEKIRPVCKKDWLKKLTPERVQVLKEFFPSIIQTTNSLLPNDVIELRNLAYKEAFAANTFIGIDRKVLIPHPTSNQLDYLISIGKQICPPLPPGSISPNAKLVNADEIFPFSEGYAVVKKGSSKAIINDKGEIKIDYGLYDFDEEGFKFGLCRVYRPSSITYSKKVTGFADIGGNLVIPYKYAYASFFSPNVGFGDLPTAVPGRTEKHLIDKNGNDVGASTVEPGLELDGDKITLSSTQEGHGETRRFGFVDYTGKVAIPATFIRVHDFHDGLAAAKKGRSFFDSKWGFINEKGQTVIPFIYDKEPGDFNSGRAFVQLNEIKLQNGENKIQYSYIDRQGKIVSQLTQKADRYCFYSAMDPTRLWDWMGFNNGFVASATSENCMDYLQLLDTDGRRYELIKAKGDFTYMGAKFNGLSSQNNDTYITVSDFLWDKIDIKGNAILFKWIWQNPKNLVDGSYLSTYGLVTPTAKLIMPPVFTKLSRFDAVSQLAYAVYNREDGSRVEGYIDNNGIFQIVKQ